MMRAIVGLLILAGVACTEEAPPPSPPVAAPTPRPVTRPELRIGVGAMLSPMATFEGYDPLLRGLATELGRPYQMVQRRTYQELNQLIVDGEVEIAFICSGAYVSMPPDAIEVLVVPEYGEAAEYHGLIVVRRDAPFRTFADLEHARFAYTDPISNTGYFYPLSRIAALGKDPASFFSSTIFSGSHDRSLLAIERDIVDAAGVFDVGIAERLASPRSELRILERSSSMAPPPVVAPRSVPAEQRKAMRAYLLSIADQPDGPAQLEALGVSRFRLPTGMDYEPIRRMMETATGAAK